MSQSIYLGNVGSANFNGNSLGAINLNGSNIWSGAWSSTGTIQCLGFKPKNKPQQWNYSYMNNRLGDTNLNNRGSLNPDVQQDGLLVNLVGINTTQSDNSRSLIGQPYTSVYLRLARTDIDTQAANDFVNYGWLANEISKFTINGYDLHVPSNYNTNGNWGYMGWGLGSGLIGSNLNGLQGITNRTDQQDFGHNVFSIEYYWLLRHEYGRPSQFGLTESVGDKNWTIEISK